MAKIGLKDSLKRGIATLGSRKMYLFGMIVVPLMVCALFAGMLEPGLPLKVPTAIVDLDQSTLSREMARNLNSTELIDLTERLESYDAAMRSVREGRTFGFFVIPVNFEKDVVAGRKPTVDFYDNLTYFIPGTLAFKGFKTVAVGTAAGVAKTKLEMSGLGDVAGAGMLQPVSVQDQTIGNPWMNYSIYLSPSFCFGAIALMIFLMTTFSITMEIKNGTSTEWLSTARGSMAVALLGKLIPQWVVWSVVGQFILSVFYCYLHFPCAHLGVICLAMELFVTASMAMGVIFASIVPNPRLAMTLSALIGILSFSFLGFSFPVQNMYGAISIFSYLIPTRYMFLTYIFSGLNGFPIYYSRIYLAALIVFPLLSMLLIGRLKKACLKPVYVP